MKFILSYMKRCGAYVALTMLIKFIGTFLELLIPYVLEHIVDDVAPSMSLSQIILWGAIMVFLAITVRFFNKTANQRAVTSAKKSIFLMRQDLFEKTISLSGNQVDSISLPSLISVLHGKIGDEGLD